MNLIHLKHFLVFSKHLNLKYAAEELYMTQPTLHAQLKTLAQNMGGALYHKKGRNLVLTKRGHKLIDLGRDLIQRAEWLETEINQMTHATIVISTGLGALTYLLSPMLQSYMHQVPAEKIAPLRIMTHSRSQTLDMVRSGMAHVGFTHIPTEGFRDLSSQILIHSHMVVIMPCDDPLAHMNTLYPHDLAQRAFIVPAHPAPYRRWVDSVFAQRSVNWKVAIEVGGWSAMISLVQQKIGLAIIPHFCTVPSSCIAIPILGFEHQNYGLVYDERFKQWPTVQHLLYHISTHDFAQSVNKLDKTI